MGVANLGGDSRKLWWGSGKMKEKREGSQYRTHSQAAYYCEQKALDSSEDLREMMLNRDGEADIFIHQPQFMDG